MAASGEKKYGLLIPKGAKKEKTKLSNVFGDSDNEEEENQGKINSKYGTTSGTKFVMKKQTQLDIDKALSEDPTVFDYDNVYDDMMGKKDQGSKKKKEIDRKPRYIGQLLKANEKRQKEDERRNERKIQKEREAEGDEFADKEVFITTAYKKKMEEKQADEERERREAALEAKLDVTNQKDMSGFYRYILNETTKDDSTNKEEENRETPVPDPSPPPSSDSEAEKQQRTGSHGKGNRKEKSEEKQTRRDGKRKDHSPVLSDSSPERDEKQHSRSEGKEKHRKGKSTTSPEHRRRHSSSESDTNMKTKIHSGSKRTRQRSVSSDSDSDDYKEKQKKQKTKVAKESVSTEDSPVRKSATQVRDNNVMDSEKQDDVVSNKKEKKPEPPKPKWVKHTTEEDLKEARARYFARKLARDKQPTFNTSID